MKKNSIICTVFAMMFASVCSITTVIAQDDDVVISKGQLAAFKDHPDRKKRMEDCIALMELMAGIPLPKRIE